MRALRGISPLYHNTLGYESYILMGVPFTPQIIRLLASTAFHRSQSEKKPPSDKGHGGYNPESRLVAAAEVEQMAGKQGAHSPAGGAETNHDTEEAAVGMDAEAFGHQWRDGGKKAPVCQAIDDGKKINHPNPLG